MKVRIISGKRNSSKTTTLKKIISKKEKRIIGYVCESDIDKNNYYLRNIISNDCFHIMQTTKIISKNRIGKYYIINDSFENAINLLKKQIEEAEAKNVEIAIDEIGRLELNNLGYNSLLNYLVKLDFDLILCIREDYVDDVINKYNLKNIEIIRV